MPYHPHASYLYPVVFHHRPWIRRPWRCKVGGHDWRRRETVVMINPPPGMRPGAEKLPPVPISDRFEQCRWCDATRPGWTPEPDTGPTPLPWDTGPVSDGVEWPKA